MGKGRDERKRATWERRLVQFRASGWTIARFCRSEGVSVRVFYYWARRIGIAGSQHASPSSGLPVARVPRRPATARPRTADAGDRRIRVRLGSQAEFSIPADALDALRCVLDGLRDANAGRDHSTFQRVVVAAR